MHAVFEFLRANPFLLLVVTLSLSVRSSVPWVGFPVGYAVSGVLLTVFGYFAMVLSQ